jgi:hypothetical protein
VELWELVAREAIRDSLAQYNWSGDALRLDGLAGAFCADGVLEVRGGDRFEGREAIVAFLGGVAGDADEGARTQAGDPGARRIVRHNLTNVRFVALAPDAAQVDSYFTVVTEIGLDHYGRYRDTFVPESDRWLIRHRFVSTDWRADGSLMAPPSSLA